MVKKNVLTPVLAGVLGLSIVGSGVGYFVVNKNADNSTLDKAQGTKEATTVSPKLSVMAENISNTLDKAQDIINGEMDYAYEGSVSFSFGKSITEEAGVDLRDFGMTVSSRQKGGNEGGDICLTYDGKTVVTINEVYSRENSEEMYVKIPELSDAYLKVNKADAEKYLEDDFGYDLDEYTQSMEDIDFDFDAEAFENDLKEYEQIIRDNFPEVKEEGTKSGSIDGVSYEYSSKTYDITGTDAQNIMVAVLEKAKTDSNVKDLYQQGLEQMYSTYSYVGDGDADIPTYEENIQELIDELKDEDMSGDDKIVLETYENGDGDFMGFTLKPDGEEGELRYIAVSTDTAEGIDMSFDSGDGDKTVVYGAMKSENDAVNGSYTISVTDEGRESTKMVYSVSDMKTVGENFSGTIRAEVTVDDGAEKSSSWFEIASTSTADDTNVVFDMGMDSDSLLKVTVTSTKTEASDVDLPGSDATIYDALDEEQLNQYLESCDLEGFQEKVKESLGEELYDQLFASSYSHNDPDDWVFEDDGWVFEDDGWDDFEWETFDIDDGIGEDQPA